MDMYGANEKQRVSQTYNVGHGRAPIDFEYVTSLPNDRRRASRRRARHFTVLSLLFFCGLLYWTSGKPMSEEVQYKVNSGYSGSSAVKLPQYYYPAGVTPQVAAILPSFNWTTHLPSKDYNWTECYDQFLCTRLAVPLDYSEPDGEQAAVALIKYPSPHKPGHKNYKGPILFNPGGPGGSGVALIISAAPLLRTLLGDEFDLIGFDPRGVLFTTPHLNIFETTIEAAKFHLEVPGSLNASSTSFSEFYVRMNVLGQLAEERVAKSATHISTPTVATDMLNIIKAAGYDKLQYWGFSYGSVLGATFAAMYPDNVGRLIIDGVEDSEDYYAGLWSNNLRDTDAALFDIYESCAKAGPRDPCPLKEDSSELVAARVDKLLSKIKEEPIPVYIPQLGAYGVVDYAMVRTQMFLTLYTTHGGGGRTLMLLLSELEKGDGTLIYRLSPRRITETLLSCTCPASGEEQYVWEGSVPTLAIGCGDAAPIKRTLAEARAFYDKMAENSSFTDMWPIHLGCAGWKIQAKDRFKGSFEHNTSYPLLLIGNTADPVTPLWNAHKMSKGFKDSVVLQQNTSGHCSISATSLCTFKAVKSYFHNGTLPEKGTVCQAESSIFSGQSIDYAVLTNEEQNSLKAAQELQQMQLIPPLGGLGTNLWGSFRN